METVYNLPNGDSVRVIDTATAGQSLGRAVQLWREGANEPLFFGDEARPEGVVISFEQWAEYETLKEEAEGDRRREEIVRRRLANDDPSQWVTFEDAARDWDLDVPPGRPRG
jgi:hypothetical protein